MIATMRQELISGTYIQADETPVDVQTRDGRGKNHQAYLWQYSCPGGSVVFDCRLGRGRDGPKRFLGQFEGILQTRPPTWPVQQSRMAGMFLRSVLDGNLLVIGTYFGHGLDFPASEAPLPPDNMGIDMLLASLSRPHFIMDLRELPCSGPLHEWFKTTHETRGLASGNETRMVAPLEAYDAILFIDTITPTPAPEKR